MTVSRAESLEHLWVEFWISLASMLRSYTAAHGLNGPKQATVELGEEQILVRHGDDWLDLLRRGPEVIWQRADGTTGKLEFTEHGTLRDVETREGDVTKIEGEEMDLVAERWARELML
jgi:hypothetical protein